MSLVRYKIKLLNKEEKSSAKTNCHLNDTCDRKSYLNREPPAQMNSLKSHLLANLATDRGWGEGAAPHRARGKRENLRINSRRIKPPQFCGAAAIFVSRLGNNCSYYYAPALPFRNFSPIPRRRYWRLFLWCPSRRA